MRRIISGLLLISLMLSACTRMADDSPAAQATASPTPAAGNPLSQFLPPTRVPGAPIFTPTPDVPHDLPTQRVNPDEYIVEAGDTLGTIAQDFGMSAEALIAANPDINPDLLYVGQILRIPGALPATPNITAIGSTFKIIPDSELVFSPVGLTLDINTYVQIKGGYLAFYTQEVDGEMLSGAQIVAKVARNYSVNPRILLAILEYQSGWVSSASPSPATIDSPIHMVDDFHTGLYRQLTWAADALNYGFYNYQGKTISTWSLADGMVIPIDPGINPGTAGVQHFFAQIDNIEQWKRDVSLNGLFTTYFLMFGYPFDLALDPVMAPGTGQPLMQLPFEPGKVWYFTGGPHGGWDSGSAWAAIDFAPPGEPVGCVESPDWAVAVADGLVVRSETGIVVLDLDGDGYEQTGWTVLYLHMATTGRIAQGTRVKAGDHIGHPSCEGGYSPYASHLHLARRYNGMWISADSAAPFILDNWVASGTGTEYDGYLTRNGVSIEAAEGTSGNEISR